MKREQFKGLVKEIIKEVIEEMGQNATGASTDQRNAAKQAWVAKKTALAGLKGEPENRTPFFKGPSAMDKIEKEPVKNTTEGQNAVGASTDKRNAAKQAWVDKKKALAGMKTDLPADKKTPFFKGPSRLDKIEDEPVKDAK